MPSAEHIDAGETYLSGCIRETFEELGMWGPTLELVKKVEREYRSENWSNMKADFEM